MYDIFQQLLLDYKPNKFQNLFQKNKKKKLINKNKNNKIKIHK